MIDEKEEEKQPFTLTASEIEGALNFLKRYHPGFWDRVDEKDISDILKISHTLFKTRPEILEVTTNMRYLPVQ